MKTLRKGDRGDEVKELQSALNNAGCIIDVDGIFGDETYAAVIAFQGYRNLRVDGIVGAETWQALQGVHYAEIGRAVVRYLAAAEKTEEFKILSKLLNG